MPKSLTRHFRRPSGFLLAIFTLAVLATACQDERSVEIKHIGVLLSGEGRSSQVDGFVDGLKEFGYRDGSNVRYTVLSSKDDRSQLPVLARELLAREVDMIAAAGGLEADAIKDVISAGGKRVPVVVMYVNAITERGLVGSRRHPGWEVTGVDNLNAELSGKRLELLKELAPKTKRVLILSNDKIAPSRIGTQTARAAAAKLDLSLVVHDVTTRADIERVMTALKPGEVDAMLLVPNATIENSLREVVLPQTGRLKIPIMGHSREIVLAGALAAYGAHFHDIGQQAARLAAKVLSGVPAQNIPFETPKRFFYTVNVEVLDTLGILPNAAARSAINEFAKPRTL
jgi:putative ABC transport system substrate-binding protein